MKKNIRTIDGSCVSPSQESSGETEVFINSDASYEDILNG